MSLQVFLQAQILGAESFLTTQSPECQDAAADLVGRCAWLTLACEVLPRALLAELKLSRMLLGSSSAEQFLLVADGGVTRQPDFRTLVNEPRFRSYLGPEMTRAAEAIA